MAFASPALPSQDIPGVLFTCPAPQHGSRCPLYGVGGELPFLLPQSPLIDILPFFKVWLNATCIPLG